MKECHIDFDEIAFRTRETTGLEGLYNKYTSQAVDHESPEAAEQYMLHMRQGFMNCVERIFPELEIFLHQCVHDPKVHNECRHFMLERLRRYSRKNALGAEGDPTISDEYSYKDADEEKRDFTEGRTFYTDEEIDHTWRLAAQMPQLPFGILMMQTAMILYQKKVADKCFDEQVPLLHQLYSRFANPVVINSLLPALSIACMRSRGLQYIAKEDRESAFQHELWSLGNSNTSGVAYGHFCPEAISFLNRGKFFQRTHYQSQVGTMTVFCPAQKLINEHWSCIEEFCLLADEKQDSPEMQRTLSSVSSGCNTALQAYRKSTLPPDWVRNPFLSPPDPLCAIPS